MNFLAKIDSKRIDAAGDVNITAGALSITSDGSNKATFTESGSGDLTIETQGDLQLQPSSGVSVTGTLTISTINEVGSDTDKFLISDSGVVKYVTGANLRSYIGAGTGSGNVSNTGTPVNNQVAIWTDATTIEGDADLTFDGTDLTLGSGVINMPNNKAVSWANSSVRGEGNILKLTATTTIQNQQNTQIYFDGGDAAISLDIHNAGTATGDDAKITFETQAAMDYAIGIDKSDSNKFKISRSDALETNTVISLDSNSDVLFASDIQASGVYVGATNTSFDLYNNGTTYLNGATTVDDGLTIADYILHSGDDSKFGFPSNDNFKITLAGSDVFTMSTTNSNFTSPIIITDSLADYSTPFITLWNNTNGGGAGIEFSDQATTQAQKGYLTFYHSDGASQGGGASMHLTSTETDFVIVAGGPSTNGRFSVYSGASNSEPDYGFYDDQDTGMLRPEANNLRFVTGGTAALDLNSSQTATFSGKVNIGSIASVGSDTDKFLMSNGGDVTFATGAEVLSYIGAGTGSGSVTSVAVTVGTGLDVSGSPITSSGTIDIDLDLSEFTDMTATMTGTDEFIVLDSSAERRKAANEIGLSIFNNDSGFTTNTGTITGSGSAGQVAVYGSSTGLVGDAGLTYNGNANKLIFNGDYALRENSGTFVLNEDDSDVITQIKCFGGNGSMTFNENSIYTAASGFYVPSGYGISAGTTATASGTIRATGNIVAYYSDEKLKDFEGTIPNALDKVCKLNGYYYTQNEKAAELGYENYERQVGVSAQEVEKVMPEVVETAPISYNNDEDYLTVDYGRLVPLLIESIKELKNEIEILKNKSCGN